MYLAKVALRFLDIKWRYMLDAVSRKKIHHKLHIKLSPANIGFVKFAYRLSRKIVNFSKVVL